MLYYCWCFWLAPGCKIQQESSMSNHPANTWMLHESFRGLPWWAFHSRIATLWRSCTVCCFSRAASVTMPRSLCPSNDVSALMVLDKQTRISLPWPSRCRWQPAMHCTSSKSWSFLCMTVMFTPHIRVHPETQSPLYQSTFPSFLCQIQMALGGKEASQAFHRVYGPHQSLMSVTQQDLHFGNLRMVWHTMSAQRRAHMHWGGASSWIWLSAASVKCLKCKVILSIVFPWQCLGALCYLWHSPRSSASLCGQDQEERWC